jgi:acetoin utilization protein AcuB
MSTIKEYMTPAPHSIGQDQILTLAHKIMREHHVRHLPVLDGGKLVGIVSDRDLKLVESIRGVDPQKVTVEEAMSPVPYTVSPETPLQDVANEMAEHRYGAVLVEEHGKCIGIFTTVDACRLLAAELTKKK